MLCGVKRQRCKHQSQPCPCQSSTHSLAQPILPFLIARRRAPRAIRPCNLWQLGPTPLPARSNGRRWRALRRTRLRLWRVRAVFGRPGAACYFLAQWSCLRPGLIGQANVRSMACCPAVRYACGCPPGVNCAQLACPMTISLRREGRAAGRHVLPQVLLAAGQHLLHSLCSHCTNSLGAAFAPAGSQARRLTAAQQASPLTGSQSRPPCFFSASQAVQDKAKAKKKTKGEGEDELLSDAESEDSDAAGEECVQINLCAGAVRVAWLVGL